MFGILSILGFALGKIIADNIDIEKYAALTPSMTLQYTLNGNVYTETIEFEMFWDKTPKTAYNFVRLIEGVVDNGKKIGYEGSKFHRIIKEFMMQGGDIINGNGTGSYSIYGGRFKDENFDYSNDAGTLSMANSGPNTNGCQFFINFKPNVFLNGRHVVFGKVTESSFQKILKIQNVETRALNDMPISDVKILKCKLVKRDERAL